MVNREILKFSRIAHRLTGILTPLGGLSWKATRPIGASSRFYSALGERRGTFGVHLAQIATHSNLIEDGLASILPARDEEV